MYRSSTPTHTFRFTENPSTYDVLLVTYAQNGAIVLEKEKDDFTFTTVTEEEETVYYGSYTLTQEETSLFKEETPVQMQIERKVSGKVSYTKKVTLTVEDVLNDEVV